MTFFDTIKDEIRKEHENNSVIPKMDPKINPLLDKKKNPENIEPKTSTSLDFLKQQAQKYSSQQSPIKKEKEPEPEIRDLSDSEKPLFERPIQPKPEPPKSKLNDPIVEILKEIRDQNIEMISLLREMKESNKNSAEVSTDNSFKAPPEKEPERINPFSPDFSSSPSSERRFL